MTVAGGAIGGAEIGAVGGPLGAAAGAVIGAVVVGVGTWWLADRMTRANEGARDLSDATTDEPCKDCPCQRVVTISRGMSPQAAQHVVDAQAAGQPSTLTLDRPGTAARRAASLRGIPTMPGMDRDEYPPATFLEGGAGASVRHIPLSDNRSAGAQIRNQLRGVPERCRITMVVGP